MILGATDQKLWMFEVFGQVLAKAGMCWSQLARVDHLRKKWRAEEKKKSKKVVVWPCPGINPRSPAGLRLIPGHGETVSFLLYLFFNYYFFFWKFGEWTRAFGRMGVQHPHFLKLAPTLGSVKSSIPHGDWRFHFFSNFFLSKFRVHLDLHIYCCNFGFMKN
jgi:hypothetical protein